MAANDVPCCETMFWVYLLISMALVAFAGLMSGLTLGLMSLNLVDLEVLTKAGQPKDRKNAEKILPIVKNQHLLLCTLLICNALAMEASIGAKLSVLIRLLVIIVFPLSYPISKLLDLLLGKRHSALLQRAELKTLVDLHGDEAGKGGELTHNETTIISGALDLTQKTATDAMTPMSEIFSLDLNSKLNEYASNLFQCILFIPFSTYKLMMYSCPQGYNELDSEQRSQSCTGLFRNPNKYYRVRDSVPLYDILNQFQKGHSHMAVVLKGIENKQQKICRYASSVASSDLESQSPALVERCNDWHIRPKKCEWKDETVTNEVLESLPDQEEEVVGIITMEDVLEELLQEEILDETDEYVDVHNNNRISRNTVSYDVANSCGIPTFVQSSDPNFPLSSLSYAAFAHCSVYSVTIYETNSP
ncbi:CBS domain protein with a domain protein [Actinidia rufa]|uniref:CBS domain protein with a domain protein n=1 Tax=Actinidia rufa TaxID=165716 RepID=A0A7J0E7F7_9ERIC|nr:CBS domain protein with a domain protein [Actinidia rufa]